MHVWFVAISRSLKTLFHNLDNQFQSSFSLINFKGTCVLRPPRGGGVTDSLSLGTNCETTAPLFEQRTAPVCIASLSYNIIKGQPPFPAVRLQSVPFSRLRNPTSSQNSKSFILTEIPMLKKQKWRKDYLIHILCNFWLILINYHQIEKNEPLRHVYNVLL